MTPKVSRQIRYATVGAVLALCLYLAADLTLLRGLLQPFFLLPYLAAAVAEGNPHSPSAWTIGFALFLQCYMLVGVGSWLIGHLSRVRSKA